MERCAREIQFAWLLRNCECKMKQASERARQASFAKLTNCHLEQLEFFFLHSVAFKRARARVALRSLLQSCKLVCIIWEEFLSSALGRYWKAARLRWRSLATRVRATQEWSVLRKLEVCVLLAGVWSRRLWLQSCFQLLQEVARMPINVADFSFAAFHWALPLRV